MFCFYSFWTDIFLVEAPIKTRCKQRSTDEKNILEHDSIVKFDES